MNKAPLAISISLAKADEEEDLLQSLELLTERCEELIIADGGSSARFVERLRLLNNTKVCLPEKDQPTGLVSQIKVALDAIPKAYRGPVLYTEPDKRDFFSNHLERFLAAAGSGEGIILAARTAEAFGTFPEGQRLTEGLMNGLCSQKFGVTGDFCYGPLIFHSDFVNYGRLLDISFGWGWRFFMMGLADRLRRSIKVVEGDFGCPPAQQGENDLAARRYRAIQLGQNATGLAAAYLCEL